MREIKFEFIIDRKILSAPYTIEKLLKMDMENILEDMEECTCTFNESVNHCECEPEFENSKITGKRQFTGLKDKNGKEIFEGDIVSIIYDTRPEEDDDSMNQKPIPAIGVVEWDDYSTGYIIRTKSPMSVRKDGTVMTSIIHGDNGEREVIGNIYENPEFITLKSEG